MQNRILTQDLFVECICKKSRDALKMLQSELAGIEHVATLQDRDKVIVENMVNECSLTIDCAICTNSGYVLTREGNVLAHCLSVFLSKRQTQESADAPKENNLQQ